MIDYIQIRITPGIFAVDSTIREIEIKVKTFSEEYTVRQRYPEDWMNSDFDRIMDSMKERLRMHIIGKKISDLEETK